LTDSFTISSQHAGLRLQDVLAARYPTYSVGSLLRRLAGGDVLVNGTPATRRRLVHEGDLVEVDIPDETMRRVEPHPLPLAVLYEDEFCIVINKPPGLATVPENDAEDYPLMSGLLQYLAHESPDATGELIRPMIVHRLDKDTTGALVVAKSLDAMRRLTQQFVQRSVRKEYLAVVRGDPPDETTIDIGITARRVKGGRAKIDARHGRPAVTDIRTEERFRGFALVRAIPRTGRTHQVRLHLKAAGFPLAADPLYSNAALYLSELKAGYRPKPGRPERPLIARQSLHAHRISFETVCGGTVKDVTAEAPVPDDMAVALKMLRKYRTAVSR